MKQDNRKIFVIFVDDKTKEAYDKLKAGKFEDKELYEFINRAIDDMKKNPRVGIHLPKRLIPKEYVQKYGINNLYKYDLPNGWRLIYTIKGSEVEILAVILEWFDHKNYDRKFGYKTS
ncbi:MAG: hypothetical protein HY392_01145 [Candidatus Diapherotrites archaeon]|nr:hypothetical protein [Candidatus Diapherotrites archaeon]